MNNSLEAMNLELGHSCRQIYDQCQMQDDLAAALRKLAQCERLTAIGLATTAISHEARNELSGLGLGLELIPLVLDDREMVVRTVEQLRLHQIRLCRLLEDVRDFATPVRLQRAVCDLGDVWRKAWSSLEPLWCHRNVSIDEQVNGVHLGMCADAYRLEQVFRNLFENSLAACSDPVVIRIMCPQATGPAAPFSFTVGDNGPGLDEEQKRDVFSAFFTTKSTGVGLGMAIVRRIIEAHGGTIAVGTGTTPGAEFSVVLPRANSA
jgi:signal transduction histidine kinase